MTHQISLETIKGYLAKQFHLPAEQIEKMLPSFVTTIKSHIQSLESALDKEDYVMLGHAGHTIKGAFLNLGLDDCAEIALIIEEKGKQGDGSINFRDLIDDLQLKVRPLFE